MKMKYPIDEWLSTASYTIKDLVTVLLTFGVFAGPMWFLFFKTRGIENARPTEGLIHYFAVTLMTSFGAVGGIATVIVLICVIGLWKRSGATNALRAMVPKRKAA